MKDWNAAAKALIGKVGGLLHSSWLIEARGIAKAGEAIPRRWRTRRNKGYTCSLCNEVGHSRMTCGQTAEQRENRRRARPRQPTKVKG